MTFSEHLSDEALAKLLEDSPAVDEIVLKANEDRARAIAVAEAAARAEREQKEREESLRDAEAEERARAEAQWPRVKAVAEAGTMTRPAFSAEAYIPPTPHLFVPSGFAAYVPRRREYDAKIVLKDPKVHIANTWTEAYEVLQMYPSMCKHPDSSTLPCTLIMIWSKENMGMKEGRGNLKAFRLYLDDLRASQVYRKPS
ncbi:hypothetical protein RHMOL_Rhmol10G0171600 [Rhododendron molle]|uniref:Uncharacterized protein n=1 Tax=Rhododendron molle TaxID=49168 RepID=A0ACC0M4F9_RHOML|nr:hypothetical protein RHMOL_Rhmol10G0171600 [Rhododendron molle]